MKLTAQTQRIDKGMQEYKRKLELLKLRKAYVKAGVLGGTTRNDTDLTNAQIASIHEYGLGKVPARPFIRPPFDIMRDQYLTMLRNGFKKAASRMSPDLFRQLLGLIGQKMVADIKNYVTQGTGVPPPLSSATIKRKGSSRPLVDSGQLLNSITFQVVE